MNVPDLAQAARRTTVALLLAGLVPPGTSVRAEPIPAIGSQEDADMITILIRSTLLALHHADLTGNYTVLRDIGSPSFRARNTAADLAAIFLPLRARDIDLEAVAILTPRIGRPPTIDDDRKLTVTGTFDTRPLPVDFEIVFDLIDRSWKLFGLTVRPLDRIVD